LLRRDRATTGGALNETLWCLMDYFDPIAVADSNGEIQERYTYSAFGLVTHLTPAFAARAASSFAWNFLFHGQFRDAETGWDNYGYRYYLPWLGRWTDRDPLEEEGGENLYAMVLNDPINLVDYLGLAANTCCPKRGEKKDINGKCCPPKEMGKNAAGEQICGRKKDEDKEKRGFIRRIFCPKITIPKPSEETYKGNKVSPESSWNIYKGKRITLSGGAKPTFYDRSGYGGTEFFVKASLPWPRRCR
jgi:RHS repeat-associated protein